MKNKYYLIINFPTRDLEFELELTDKECRELYEDMVLHSQCRFSYKGGSVVIPKAVLENNIFQIRRKY